MSKIILTGDRPTGRLHIGHYVGSLKQRVELQNMNDFDKMYIMIADSQALTDNYGVPQKIRNNILEVMLDYLSVGLDPSKVTFFVQSRISALPELTAYYMNLVTLSRLLRNPTVKSEIKLRGFDDEKKGIPVGFANYPISQAADITAFKANIIPVGDDQLPMIEQAREIVRSFNSTYKEVLTIPNASLPKNEACLRLPGTDGNAKMSKSLGNCIYLADDSKTVKEKIYSMYTDPNHIRVEDPGRVEGNMVFVYLDAFSKKEDFKKYLSEFEDLDDLKKHYQMGGVGDMKIKKFLYEIMEEMLVPIRKRREYYQNHLDEVIKILEDGTMEANKEANKTLNEVREAIGINYFEDENFIKEYKEKYGSNKK